jgi:hypothetical protein
MSDSSGDYVPLVPYNGTIATGGNSLTDDLNLFYNVRFWNKLILACLEICLAD